MRLNKKILIAVFILFCLGAAAVFFFKNNGTGMSTVPPLPELVPYDPAKLKPPPPLPSMEVPTGPVNAVPKLVPPRKDLPPAPPVPNIKDIMAKPVNKELRLVPPRKDLPPAPPLPPRPSGS